MSTMIKIKLSITTGLALFAMFFGAGNMVFPLQVGAVLGTHLLPSTLSFIFTGVLVPFLGVFAVSLYEGNYWDFFNRIGKKPAFLLVTFLILIIGPLFAGPRTEVITYHTLLPVLPSVLKNEYLFDALYFGLVLLVVAKQNYFVDIIGLLFSPTKIIIFSILILIGIVTAMPFLHSSMSYHQTVNYSLSMGYNTMDLLATFFFCSVVYKNIKNKCAKGQIASRSSLIKMMLFSCLIGVLLISLIYSGFIYIAATHAQFLQNTPTEDLIAKIAQLVLGQYGMVFVGICVSVACLATGATLTEVTTNYLYSDVFKQKISRKLCLLSVLLVMYAMAILGFDGIMNLAAPILKVIYPALILLCVVNIVLKLVSSEKTNEKIQEMA